MSESRSFIIPVIDFSPHSAFNIETLLDDLRVVQGEVICIFNDIAMFDRLRQHTRINKYVLNNTNVGVSRSWNIGLQLAEGKTVFILNADLHLEPNAIDVLDASLHSLNRAVVVGPQGTHLDYKSLSVKRYFEKGTFDSVLQTDDVSGFFFALHRERLVKHKLLFDVEFSPCLFEEWDFGLQARQAGLCCYAVPTRGFEHYWGVSSMKNRTISYFGHDLGLYDIWRANKNRFISKWTPIFPELFGPTDPS